MFGNSSFITCPTQFDQTFISHVPVSVILRLPSPHTAYRALFALDFNLDTQFSQRLNFEYQIRKRSIPNRQIITLISEKFENNAKFCTILEV